MLGFVAIHPWQIQALNDEWMDVIDGLEEFFKDKNLESQNKNNFENYLNKRRAAHPTYRKR